MHYCIGRIPATLTATVTVYVLFQCMLCFCVKVFDGNDDSATVVYNILNPPFTARYVRIVPVEFHKFVSIRLEIYGCPGIFQ